MLSLGHSKYSMCIKYLLFYTVFKIKEDFQIFREMVKKKKKHIENEEMSLFFSQLCLHVDWLLKEMQLNSSAVTIFKEV